jgi:hypothetical protein
MRYWTRSTRLRYTISEFFSSLLGLIPALHTLFAVDGAGHDLLPSRAAGELSAQVANEFKMFVKISGL